MKNKAFTLIELLVVISIIALLIGLLLPALGNARTAARQMTNSTQTRGIHQGMVIFAQSNKGAFPGIDEYRAGDDQAFVDNTDIDTYNGGGTAAGSHVAARFAIMLEDNLFTPEYAISPAERDDAVNTGAGRSPVEMWDASVGAYGFNRSFFSYALPEIAGDNAGTPLDGGRFIEWQDSMNGQNVVISDRLIYWAGNVNNNPTTHRSLWSDDLQNGEWGGSLTWNDGHVEYSSTSVVENTRLDNVDNPTDNIFQNGPPPTGGTTADTVKMIFRGWNSVN